MEQENKKRILVVDDEAEVREVVTRLLEEHGFETAEACDASEAIATFSSEPFDMVITDVKMPGDFSGIDLLKIIKAGFDIPVIVITGYGSMELALTAMRHGASEFVPKPLNFPAFISIVKDKLNVKYVESSKGCIGDISFGTKFELDNDPGVYSSLQDFVIDFAVKVGLDDMRSTSLWVSAKEALKNAMVHGNEMQAGKKVSFLLLNMPREIAVSVADEGLGYSTQSHRSDEMHHLKGLELIESLADDVQFNESRNEIKIVFLK